MTREPEKKGFFARINEALYETVDTAEREAAPERESGDAPEQSARTAAPPVERPTEVTAELAAKVRADVAGRGQAFAQFLALAGSFTEFIPEESGRYRAAMKALEKTGNIGRKEVLRAANDQLRALGSQRDVFAGAVNRKRDELKTLGSGVEAIRARIADLQQSIARLQAEEQEILRNTAVEAGKITAAEEGFASLLVNLESEIKAAQEKIEKYVPG